MMRKKQSRVKASKTKVKASSKLQNVKVINNADPKSAFQIAELKPTLCHSQNVISKELVIKLTPIIMKTIPKQSAASDDRTVENSENTCNFTSIHSSTIGQDQNEEISQSGAAVNITTTESCHVNTIGQIENSELASKPEKSPNECLSKSMPTDAPDSSSKHGKAVRDFGINDDNFSERSETEIPNDAIAPMMSKQSVVDTLHSHTSDEYTLECTVIEKYPPDSVFINNELVIRGDNSNESSVDNVMTVHDEETPQLDSTDTEPSDINSITHSQKSELHSGLETLLAGYVQGIPLVSSSSDALHQTEKIISYHAMSAEKSPKTPLTKIFDAGVGVLMCQNRRGSSPDISISNTDPLSLVSLTLGENSRLTSGSNTSVAHSADLQFASIERNNISPIINHEKMDDCSGHLLMLANVSDSPDKTDISTEKRVARLNDAAAINITSTESCHVNTIGQVKNSESTSKPEKSPTECLLKSMPTDVPKSSSKNEKAVKDFGINDDNFSARSETEIPNDAIALMMSKKSVVDTSNSHTSKEYTLECTSIEKHPPDSVFINTELIIRGDNSEESSVDDVMKVHNEETQQSDSTDTEPSDINLITHSQKSVLDSGPETLLAGYVQELALVSSSSDALQQTEKIISYHAISNEKSPEKPVTELFDIGVGALMYQNHRASSPDISISNTDSLSLDSVTSGENMRLTSVSNTSVAHSTDLQFASIEINNVSPIINHEKMVDCSGHLLMSANVSDSPDKNDISTEKTVTRLNDADIFESVVTIESSIVTSPKKVSTDGENESSPGKSGNKSSITNETESHSLDNRVESFEHSNAAASILNSSLFHNKSHKPNDNCKNAHIFLQIQSNHWEYQRERNTSVENEEISQEKAQKLSLRSSPSDAVNQIENTVSHPGTSNEKILAESSRTSASTKLDISINKADSSSLNSIVNGETSKMTEELSILVADPSERQFAPIDTTNIPSIISHEKIVNYSEDESMSSNVSDSPRENTTNIGEKVSKLIVPDIVESEIIIENCGVVTTKRKSLSVDKKNELSAGKRADGTFVSPTTKSLPPNDIPTLAGHSILGVNILNCSQSNNENSDISAQNLQNNLQHQQAINGNYSISTVVENEEIPPLGNRNNISDRHSLQDIAAELECDIDGSNDNFDKIPETIVEVLDQLDDPELNNSFNDSQEELRGNFSANSFDLEGSTFVNPNDIHDFASSSWIPLDSSGNEELASMTDDPNDKTYNSLLAQQDVSLNETEESIFNAQSESLVDDPSVDASNTADNTPEKSVPFVAGSIDNTLLSAKPKGEGSKKNFCFICKTFKAVISVHLEKVHSNHPKVKEFAHLPKGDPVRYQKISALRVLGNSIHNTDPKYNTTGELLVPRRPKNERSATEYRMCHNCKGMFSHKTIRRHRQRCLGTVTGDKMANTILSRRIEGRIHADANSRLVKIFSVFNDDEVVRLLRYDYLIIKFANCLCEKYRKLKDEDMIRARLRLLGRLLLTMKKLDKTITDFKSIYHPTLYKTMIEAVNILAHFDPETEEHEKPSIVTNIGIYIKAVGHTLKIDCIEKVDDVRASYVEKYLFLHKELYSVKLNRIALETQNKKKRQQPKPLPTTSDIRKLAEHVMQGQERAMESLQNKFTYNAWLDLSKFTLISIQIFNRRRAGEIERVSIADLKNVERIDEETNPEVFRSLTKEQKEVAKQYSRFMITGKRGRDVPVLLDSQMETALGLILKYRQSAKLPPKNPYVFGTPGFADGRFKYLRACQLMRQFSEECGAEFPERLRGTFLRKHMATNCAAKNIDENEIVDIANFMGHAEAIHRSHYRQSVATRDVTNVVRMLRSALGADDDENEEGPNDINFMLPNTQRDNINFHRDRDENTSVHSANEGRSQEMDYTEETSHRSTEFSSQKRHCWRKNRIISDDESDEDGDGSEKQSEEIQSILEKDYDETDQPSSSLTISNTQLKSRQNKKLLRVANGPKNPQFIFKSAASGIKRKSRQNRKKHDSSDAEESTEEGLDIAPPRKKKAKYVASHSGNSETIQKKKGIKRRWTDEEKAAVFSAFKNHVNNYKLPSTKEIRVFLKHHPTIDRSIDQIRTWASNVKKKNLMDHGNEKLQD